MEALHVSDEQPPFSLQVSSQVAAGTAKTTVYLSALNSQFFVLWNPEKSYVSIVPIFRFSRRMRMAHPSRIGIFIL